jgi:hypothetical protein
MLPKIRDMDEYLPVALSGADPTGVLFSNGSLFFRGINESQADEIQNLLNTAFWNELSRRHFVPLTRITEKTSVPESLRDFPLVLEHESVSPVSYPHEWSFEMVKAAALAFLDLIELAETHGYTSKDAHLYNWMFRGVQPVWVDIGSFTRTSSSPNSLPWAESFYTNVVTPLNLWSNGMQFLANRAVSCPAKLISADEAVACNYPSTRGSGVVARNLRFVFRVLLFPNGIPENTRLRRIVKHLLGKDPLGQVNHLRKSIRKLSYGSSSQWGGYHEEFLDVNNHIKKDARFSRISDLVADYSPLSILDLAGNAGILSQLIAEKLPGVPVICTDYDSGAIDSLFRRIQITSLPNLSMAVLDFMSPTLNPAEKSPQTRFKSDCVIALAITHHLLLSQGYSFDQIFKTIGSYSKRIVFIEYMPLGLHDGQVAPQIPSWYNKENFEKSFSKFFNLLNAEQLDINRILYIGQKRENVENSQE